MAHLNRMDSDMLRNERDASPVRFQAYGPRSEVNEGESQPGRREEAEETEEAEERHLEDDGSSVQLEEIGGQAPKRQVLGRTQSEIINYLERHPTALERIETHRSQHLFTVGSHIRSRRSSTLKDLPKFGANKPYPPALPEQEEYVVEFNGPDDPTHAQNWPTKKKYGILHL